jgi:hypothetical protein
VDGEAELEAVVCVAVVELEELGMRVAQPSLSCAFIISPGSSTDRSKDRLPACRDSVSIALVAYCIALVSTLLRTLACRQIQRPSPYLQRFS